MEFKDALNNRISVRAYENIDLPDEVILELLKAGHLAPSAKNRQPWRFKIIKGKEKNRLGKNLIDAGNSSDPEEGIAKYGNSISATGSIIIESSVLVVVYKNKEDLWDKSDLISIGAAMQNIFLAAADVGLGSLCIGDIFYIYNDLYIEGMDLVASFVLGYPDEIDHDYKRIRKPIKEVIIK